MATERLRFQDGVTLVGGGALSGRMLREALALAPHLIAADGGANRLPRWGLEAEAVIGDIDSLTHPGAARVIRIAEQETTDFEKCLHCVAAPIFLCVGFIGKRFDHSLGALHALLAQPDKPALLIGKEDLAWSAGTDLRLDLEPGARVSLFPLRETRALGSAGLEWPLHGLTLAPGARIGVSNRACAPRVEARFDRTGVIALVERRFLHAAVEALRARH